MSPRRLPALALVALLPLVAGCSDDDSSDGTTTTVAAGGSTTAARDDAGDATKDDLVAAIERTRRSKSMEVTLRLAFDGGSTLGSQAASIAGPIVLDGSAMELTSEVDGQAGAIRLVVLDGQAWVGGEGEEMQGALPDGVDWATLPAEDLFASPGFTNPGDLTFLYLLNGAQDIEATGEGSYRFGIDLEEAVRSSPADVQEELAGTLTFSGAADPEITGEVQLDDEGRIVALDVVGVQTPTADEREQLDLAEGDELTIELHVAVEAIDEPVEIAEPDGEIVDIADAPEVATLIGVTAG